MRFQQVSLKLEKLGNGDIAMNYPPDHGLPLVQLKERRRELVVALRNRVGEINDDDMRRIALLQQTISACEDVIADLDCEQNEAAWDNAERSVRSFPAFGRRSLVHSPA